jgi:hypothetical protein
MAKAAAMSKLNLHEQAMSHTLEALDGPPLLPPLAILQPSPCSTSGCEQRAACLTLSLLHRSSCETAAEGLRVMSSLSAYSSGNATP